MSTDRPQEVSAESAAPEWPPVQLPADRPRRPGRELCCTAVERDMLTASDAGDRSREDTLAAVYAALLHRCTAQEQIGFAMAAGADAAQTSVRLTVGGDSTVRELAAEVRPAAHTDAPSVALRFAAAGQLLDAAEPFELQLVVRDDDVLELRYDERLYDRATAARFLGHYRTMAADALHAPDRPVSQLKLLTDAELHRTLVEWNSTQAEFDDGACLHHAFEGHAARTPGATAAVHDGRRFTFGEINTAANRLAHHLRSLGVGPDVRVGLCLERSADLLVAILGILKAGGAYVPLDPEYPALRIAAMVEGTSCSVMVSSAGLTANLPAAGDDTALVLLGEDGTDLSGMPGEDPGPAATPGSLCYIIHTSGSTGAPKPIALQHRGVVNNLADLNTRLRVGPGDSVLSLSSSSFDMSVYEYLGITAAGGRVVIPTAGRTKDPAHWAELLTAENVTIWNSAPALLELLVDHLEQTGAPPVLQLRGAMLGGDWIPVPLPRRAGAVAPRMRILALGGATEASIHSTVYEVGEIDPDAPSIPYGRPMANQRTYILDDAFQPVPPGVPGELYLAGTGLARGYLDQPERTAERFIEWSHGEVSDRLYRTGDVARFGPDGLIELLGRKDFQVKLRGLRVELGEIEAVLRSHAAVQQSAVVAHREQLVAYVVADGGVDDGELLALAAARLPEYMVPKAVVTLDRLPLTPNGKVDRKALPVPDLGGTAYRAPGTATESLLAGICAEVLGVERVGVDDDFVSLGGDSIRAIQVVTRARARGLTLTPRRILQERTVARIARTAADETALAAGSAEETAGPLVVLGDGEREALQERYPGLSDVWPLTAMQAGMLFESMLGDTGADTYQMQTVYHLAGPVDAARMRSVGRALLQRYANLRAAFVPDGAGNLVQVVVDGVELPWQEADLAGLPAGEREEAFREFLAQDRAVRFDLAAPPLLRLALVRLGPERSELVLTAHHALLDGWSEQVIAEELLKLYASAGETPDGDAPERDPSADVPERGYRDFLAWLSRQDKEASARAWAEELDGLDGPTLLVPGAASRTRAADAGEVGEVRLALTEEESARLARCGAGLGVTVNTLVQGAWAVLLSALTGRQDVVFGAAVSGRPGTLAGVESMVGLFINTLPVRARCAPGDTYAELLTGLQTRQTALMDHHQHSLTDIHQAAGVDALFDTLVAFQSYPSDRAGIAAATAAAGVEITGLTSAGGANYPLALIVEDGRMTLQYHRNVFGRSAAEDIAARFRSVLGQLTRGTDRCIGTADVLLRDEREQLAARGREIGAPPESADAPGGTVVELFEQQAASTPDAVAVVLGDGGLTYRELNARADRLAHELTRRGLGPETVVGLDLPRSPELAVALLGTLKSRSAYVLFGSEPQRAAALAETAPELVVTHREGPSGADRSGAVHVSLDELQAAADLEGDDGTARIVPPRRRQLACVRYEADTPNGMAVTHRALADGVLNFASAAGLQPGDRMLAGSPHLDAAAFEMLAALCAGAAVDVPDDLMALAGQGWSGEVISTVAPLFAAVLNRCTAPVRARGVVFTGAVLLESFVRRVREAVPGAQVVGVYGPAGTARAVALPSAPAPGGEAGGDQVPPGTVPAGGVRAYVLSPALQLAPPGVTGELYLAGEVGRGHQGNVALTAQRFVADPYGPPGSRMYRTGDFARWNSDGELEYAGSTGMQVTVRGHRFRTDDVEAALTAHPAVSQAAVVGRPEDGAGGARLLGHVVPLRGATLDTEEVREFVGRHLPEYMVPAALVTAAELPFTADGGVDREALGASGEKSAADGRRAGRTPQEEALCALFAEVLGAEEVGIDDNFFTLGGNSLTATRLIGRMRRTLGIEASIRKIFQFPTIAELSGQVQAAGATKSRPRLRKMTKE